MGVHRREITADNTDGLDKESITADPHNPNLVYAAWDPSSSPGGSQHASDQGFFHAHSYKSQTFFSKSTDGGRTWSSPRRSTPIRPSRARSAASFASLPDGTLLDGLVTYGNAAWKGGKCASIRS